MITAARPRGGRRRSVAARRGSAAYVPAKSGSVLPSRAAPVDLGFCQGKYAACAGSCSGLSGSCAAGREDRTEARSAGRGGAAAA